MGFRFVHEKLAPFSERAEMLGVVVDMSVPGCVLVDNKESRKDELAREVQRLFDTGHIEIETLPFVLGRIQYAELRVTGRQGKLAMADIREWERLAKGQKFIDLDVTSKEAFQILLGRINSGRPRRIAADVPGKPVLIFTDSAVEATAADEVDATVGGVMICDRITSMFRCRVDQSVLQHWLSELSHPVGLAELYGVLVAMGVWKQHLENRRVILYFATTGLQ